MDQRRRSRSSITTKSDQESPRKFVKNRNVKTSTWQGSGREECRFLRSRQRPGLLKSQSRPTKGWFWLLDSVVISETLSGPGCVTDDSRDPVFLSLWKGSDVSGRTLRYDTKEDPSKTLPTGTRLLKQGQTLSFIFSSVQGPHWFTTRLIKEVNKF